MIGCRPPLFCFPHHHLPPPEAPAWTAPTPSKTGRPQGRGPPERPGKLEPGLWETAERVPPWARSPPGPVTQDLSLCNSSVLGCPLTTPQAILPPSPGVSLAPKTPITAQANVPPLPSQVTWSPKPQSFHFLVCKIDYLGDFPSGPKVKNLPCNIGDAVQSLVGKLTSHKSWSN